MAGAWDLVLRGRVSYNNTRSGSKLLANVTVIVSSNNCLDFPFRTLALGNYPETFVSRPLESRVCSVTFP